MTKINKISIFKRNDNKKAIIWEEKITKWLTEKHPEIKIIPLPKNSNVCSIFPDVIIVLGGDGTIIEMAQRHNRCNSLIMGLNLGHIGFMASIRNQKEFISGISKLLKGKYRIDERIKIKAEIIRGGKKYSELSAVNEITVQSLFGIVELKIEIEKHPFQYIRGNGVMVSTASGSTAYNLSAHGPIIMPDIKCFIITELLDHNLPTPSVVIKEDKTLSVTIEDFRKNDKFTITKTGEKADVIITSDGTEIISLKKGDKIIIKSSDDLVKFVEIKPNYFLKSLKEKFAFR